MDIQRLLRQHQVEPWSKLVAILQRYQSAVDLSAMGTGKTFVGAAVAKTLSLPTLAVVPKIAVTAWRRAAEHFDDSISVIGYEKLRTGNTEFGTWEHPYPDNPASLEYFKCYCCQCIVNPANPFPCYAHPRGIHCVELHRKSWNYGRFSFHPGVRFVIFDEVHRCGARDSLNAEMLIGAKRQHIKVLGISATAACNPLNMRALGYNLDLHNDKTDLIVPCGKLQQRVLPNFYRWASHYGCRRDARFKGWKWMVGREKQLATMETIRESFLGARGVRVRTSDIPGFPECVVTAELYDLDEGGVIDRLYAEMADALSALSAASADDIAEDHPLTRILRARQKVELLKVPIAVELARDYVERGCSVGIFVNFSQTLSELRERLKCDCIIDGSAEGVRHRQRNIDEFNANNARIILVNSEAGGVAVSLPDVTGHFPRVGLVFPGFNAVTFRQILGRFPRENSKSACLYRVLFAANTVEVTAHRNLRAKLDNLDKLNNDDMVPENLHLLGSSATALFN